MTDTEPNSSGTGPRLVIDDDDMSSRLVGGKFAKQHVMRSSGIHVPRFFCLTQYYFSGAAQAIAPQVRKLLSRVSFTDSASVQHIAKQIEQLFLQLELSQDQERELYAAFDRLFPPTQLVAVRASMVGFREEESEDSQDNPFAGISSTFLYVTREQMIDKIRQCWASGYSSEAMLYRHAQGMSPDGFSVAVGVQAMVPGERAFVMFTCNPQELTRNAIIIAGHGIGEGIVQESVPVDHYFINSLTGEIRRELADKAEMLTLDEAAGHGLVRRPVAADKRHASCLSDEEIAALVQAGRNIETLFGCPQDIEGAFTADGDLYFLQSRPIAIDFNRYRVWSSANISESFPGCTTPLTFSFAKNFYYAANYDCARRIGVPERTVMACRESMQKMLGYLEGRIYYSITHMSKVAELHPLFSGMRTEWERLGAELHSLYNYAPQEEKTSPFAIAKKYFIKLRTVAIMLWTLLRIDERYREFGQWWEGLMKTRRGMVFSGRHPLSLLADYNEVWRQFADWWGLTLVNWQLMIGVQSAVENTMKQWGIDSDGSLLSDLLCGDLQLKGVEIVLSAVRLTDMVKAHPGLARRFADQQAEELWQALEEGELPEDFSAAVRKHVHEYGDRGLQELKLEQPNLRDTPWELLRMVKSYAAKEFTAATLYDIELANRKSGEERLAVALAGSPLRRLVLRVLLKALRKILHYREEGRYMRSELFGYSKNIFKAMGEYLAKSSVLRSPGDIFYLHYEEIFGYLDGTGISSNLQELADKRKRELDGQDKKRPMKEFTTSDIVAVNIPQEIIPGAAQGAVLRGIGSSAGKVRGYAKVIENPSLEGDLGDNTILVARETDPGWLFLMLAAKGIVVERGSMLSHTAITGRKFGIPTVVAVAHATALIADGAFIEIDGAGGTVQLLDQQAHAPADAKAQETL